MKSQNVQAGKELNALLAVVKGGLCATLSGVLLALALPPYNIPLLGFAAFAPLLAVAFHAPRYTSLLYALITAICTALILMALPFDIWKPGDSLALIPFVAFGAILSLVLMAARRLSAENGWAMILGVSSVAVLSEWLAARADFPYTVALTLWRDAPVLWVAGWLGVWGLVFLVWMVNTALAMAWVQRQLVPCLKVSVLLLLLLHALGWIQMNLPRKHETVRVAVVQQRSSDYSFFIRQAKVQGAHLVVLPEVCCDPASAARWARANQVWLIFGYWNGRNCASLASPEGVVSEPYYKMYPYGSETVSWLPSDPVRAFESPFGTLAAVICYDTMFTEPCRRQALNGARLIAVPTLDPTVPNLAFHHLHAAITTLRAAEHRIPMARSEYAAASMIVDEWGRIRAYLDTNDSVAVADVPLGSGRGTLASHVGDWFVLIYLFAAVSVWYRVARR